MGQAVLIARAHIELVRPQQVGVNDGKPGQKDNILLIISDDQGAWALGAAGNAEIKTPVLDALAAEGTYFRNAFCTSPVCSPARASIMTGLIPSQHGVHDWIREGNSGAEAVDYIAGLATYADLLSDKGWRCGMSGKWHLGASDHQPSSFKHWYALDTGMSDYNAAHMYRDGSWRVERGYITDLITEDAVGFIERCVLGSDRFLACVNYTAPHSPWVGQHPSKFLDMYRDCEFLTCPQGPPHPWGPSLAGDNLNALRDPLPSLAGYFAAVTAMDEGIGRILSSLDRLGIRDQTTVIFIGDNGFNAGHHGLWGKGNTTFPLNVYDTSVKVPLIIDHPGVRVRGQIRDELVSAYDILPTLMQIFGLDHPRPTHLPGHSLLPLLGGHAVGERDHVVVFDEYGPVRMIRTQDWKLAKRYPNGPDELYNMQEDPGEERNRISEDSLQGVVRELRFELERWFERFVYADIDGTKQAVTGIGQRAKVGAAGNGEEAFYPLPAEDFPLTDLRHKPW